ncbi:MAG: GNAT family N-acetyltransferase [Anaerolineales bacterium]|nr:GNAT family N-acetyltransferase [Anaerolineales bacterium]
MDAPAYAIRPFRPADQSAARDLILAGLAERWGALDPSLNRDLDDIWRHYVAGGGAFLVVERAGEIVGTGGLSVEAPGVSRIERVSVARAHRRRGLARAISQALVAEARRRGDTAVVVETTASWRSAVALYRACGFTPEGERDGDLHMRLALD